MAQEICTRNWILVNVTVDDAKTPHPVPCDMGAHPETRANDRDEDSIVRAVRRRSVVRWGFATLGTGAVGTIAGCLGSDSNGSSSGPDLQIADRDAEITTFGNVVATVIVVNEGDEAGTGEVWVEVDLNAGDTYSESEVVRLEPDDTQTYEIEVNVGAVDALASDEAEINVWLEA